MSKWKRRMLWLGAIAAVTGAYAWFLGVQTFFAIYARRIGRQIPIVATMPGELQDLTVSETHGEKVSFQGAEFEVPWDDVDSQKTRIVGNWALIVFRSGNSILLCVGPPDGFISSISKSKTPDPKLFTAVYGPEVLRSDYDLFKAIFKTTPSQITLLTPASRAAGLSSVLLVKAILPPTTDWAILNIRSNSFKGFQLGNPLRRPKKISLELFGNDIEIEINIEQNTTGPAPAITQSDINRIIQTVHKGTGAQSTLAVNPS